MIGPGRFFRPRLAYSADEPEIAGATVGAVEFRRAMLPHMDAAYNYARYLTRDADHADDVVQEAFLRALRSFATWRGESARAWLFAIVRNCFLASTRDRHWHADEPDAQPEPIEDDNPETIAVAQNEAEMLRRTIAALPQPFRETLVLRELEELSYKEIAQVTGVPVGTVMSRLARARTMLAELLLGDARLATEARS